MNNADVIICLPLFLVVLTWIVEGVILQGILAKPKPHAEYDGFNCEIYEVSENHKHYYMISWKAANNRWVLQPEPIPGYTKVYRFKTEEAAIDFIHRDKRLLLREDFAEIKRRKIEAMYEVVE